VPAVTPDIPGWSDLIDWFGYSPTFHDAVVEKVDLRANPPLIQLHTWHMTSETDERGYYKTAKHITVRFIFEDIQETTMDGESSDDILNQLRIEKSESGQTLFLCSVMDKGGFVRARKIRVEIEPRAAE